ncbi:hypothetical protein Ciccas_012000 [Cichlidogyrus casuarinus]|uniref:Uncharacterized protein n=1 Tax=Cichlidogyrus casuarinus TaxID=1844966 RepID=A0ABD2PPN1_9PLAT
MLFKVVLTYGSNRVIGRLARVERPLSCFPCPDGSQGCDSCIRNDSAALPEDTFGSTPHINLDKKTWELLEQVGLDSRDLLGQSSDESPAHSNKRQKGTEFEFKTPVYPVCGEYSCSSTNTTCSSAMDDESTNRLSAFAHSLGQQQTGTKKRKRKRRRRNRKQ